MSNFPLGARCTSLPADWIGRTNTFLPRPIILGCILLIGPCSLAFGSPAADRATAREAMYASMKKLEVGALPTNRAEARRTVRLAIERILAEEDALINAHILTHLRQLPDDALQSVVARIARRTEFPTAAEAHGVINAIVAVGSTKWDKQHIEGLSQMAYHPRGVIRNQALDIMARSGNPQFMPVFDAKLADEQDAATRVIAWAGVARVDSSRAPEAIREIQQLAEHSDMEARWVAGEHLVELTPQAEFVIREGDDPTLANAARAILDARSRRPFDERALWNVLHASHHDLRMRAIETLADQGSPQIRRELIALGSSDSWRERLVSAYYLFRTKESTEALKRLRSETHPMVQTSLLASVLTD